MYFETNDSGIGVVDCPSHSFVRFISTDRSERFCPVRSRNRLYYWEGRGGGVGVVDCFTDSVIAVIALDVNPQMVFNENEDKLYVHDHDYDQVLVIDAATNTLVDSLPDLAGNENCNPLCLNSTLNRLYCANADGLVTVIDCEHDSIVAEIEARHIPFQPCVNESLNRLYVRTGEPTRLTVIDCLLDSVVAYMPIYGWIYDTTMCLAEFGRVYATSRGLGVVTLYDCAGDTVTSAVETGRRPAVVIDIPGHNKLYCTETSGGALLVLDALSGRVTKSMDAGDAREILFNPVTDRVYRATHNDSTALKVFDPVQDSMVATVMGPEGFEPVSCNTVNGKVYCLNSNSQNLLVVDGVGDSVRALVTMPAYPLELAFCPSVNKCYVATGTADNIYLTIVDGVTDVVRRDFALGNGLFAAFAVNDDLSRVYLYCRSQLYGIDGRGDSVIVVVPGWARDMLYNHARNALYCVCDDTVVVRDPLSLQPLDSIPLLVSADMLRLDTIANKLYCFEESGDSVEVIDCATNQSIAILGLLPEAGTMAWCPEQRKVYVTHGSSSALSVIRDSAVAGVAQGQSGLAWRLKPAATVVCGALFLPPASGVEREASNVLLDISGRKVLELHPGANDVRALAPGVYFVRSEPSVVGRQPSAVTVRKVILQR